MLSAAEPVLTCAVDVGSTLVKASLRRGVDDVVARSAVPFPRPANGEYGSAHEAVSRAVDTAVGEVCAAAVPDVVAVSAQMSGLSMLDRDGRPLGPLLSGVEECSPRFGVPVDLRGSGCADAGISGLAKFLWCDETFPGLRSRAARLGGIKEYVLHALTGRWVTDRATACASGFYDVQSGGWSATTLRETRLAEDLLPDLAEMDSVVGRVQPTAAAACGVPAGTPVVCGVGDGPAANMSAGAVGDGVMCFSHGTTVVARVLVRGALPDVGLPLFVQHVSGPWKCVGIRFAEDPASGCFIPTGRTTERVPLTELCLWLEPMLEAFGVCDIRSVGGRPVELPPSWPVRAVPPEAQDGTRALALLTNGVSLEDQARQACGAVKGAV